MALGFGQAIAPQRRIGGGGSLQTGLALGMPPQQPRPFGMTTPQAPAPATTHFGYGGGGLGGIAQNAIRGANEAGFLSATGSPQLRAQLLGQARRRAENQRRRGSVLASLVGLDPMAQRQAMLDADRQVSGDTANFLNDAFLQEGLGNRDYARGLFNQERGMEFQRNERLAAEKAAKKAQKGGLLGSLAGLGLSALPFGGIAKAGLGMLGGGGGGGPLTSMGQQGWTWPTGGK